MTVFGWDASDYDWSRGPMDYAAAHADGIVFATHKATEGTRTKHLRYGEALRRARDAGIPVLGAYCVVRTPGVGGHGSVSAQVDYLLSHADRQTPWWRDHPHWMWQVDLEHWEYDKVRPEHGVRMCEILAGTGKRTVLYAPKWAYGDSIGGSWPLWASNYGENPAAHYRQAYPGDDSSRWVSYSKRTPSILQYGSQTIIGSQRICDANAWRGTLSSLLTWTATANSKEKENDMEPLDQLFLRQTREMLSGVIAGDDPVTRPQNLTGATETVPNMLARRLSALEARPPVQLSDVDRMAIVTAIRAELGAEVEDAIRRVLLTLNGAIRAELDATPGGR